MCQFLSRKDKGRRGKAGATHVVEVSHIDEEIVRGHSLRPALIPQTLDRVQCLQRREACRVHEAENEHHGNDAPGSRLGDGNGRAAVVSDGEAGLWIGEDIGRVEGGDGDEDEGDDEGRGHELLAPAPFVGEGSADQGACE